MQRLIDNVDRYTETAAWSLPPVSRNVATCRQLPLLLPETGAAVSGRYTGGGNPWGIDPWGQQTMEEKSHHRLKLAAGYSVASTASAVLVLLYRATFTTDVLIFAFKVTGVAGSAIGCV